MKLLKPIFIDNYINDSAEKVTIERGSRVLLDSPTGSGKTTFALNDRSHNHSIVLVPTIVIGKAKEATEGVLFYYDGKIPNFEESWLGTYDNILRVPPHILRESIVWIDEIHLIASATYRKTLSKIITYILKYARTVVGLSGTIEAELFRGSFDELITVRKRTDRNIEINNIFTGSSFGNVLNEETFAFQEATRHIDAGVKVLMLLQNKAKINTLIKQLKSQEGFEHEDAIIKYVSHESDLTVTNSDNAVEMIKQGKVSTETKLIIGTSVIVEGWDLKDDNEWTVIICGEDHRTDELKLPSTVIQLCNRLRNKNDIVCHIQRGYLFKEYTPKLLSEEAVSAMIVKARKREREEFLAKGVCNNHHIVEIDNKIFKSPLPLIQAKYRNNNRRYTTEEGYIKYALKMGISEVNSIYVENEVGGTLESKVSLLNATIEIIKANPHSSVSNDNVIADYLAKKDGIEVHPTIKQFIKVCGYHKINARKRIAEIMSIISCYEHEELIKNLSHETVSIGQLLSAKERFKKGAIAKYGVRRELLKKCKDKAYTKTQLQRILKNINVMHFNGKTNKDTFIFQATKKGAKITSHLNGLISVSLTKVGKNNTKMYQMTDEYVAVFKHTQIPIKLEWINEKVREEIFKEMDVNKKPDLKTIFTEYVEFFDII